MALLTRMIPLLFLFSFPRNVELERLGHCRVGGQQCAYWFSRDCTTIEMYTLKEQDLYDRACMPWSNFTRHWRWEDRRCRNPDNDMQGPWCWLDRFTRSPCYQPEECPTYDEVGYATAAPSAAPPRRPPCELTQWSHWSPCKGPCGFLGLSERSRVLLSDTYSEPRDPHCAGLVGEVKLCRVRCGPDIGESVDDGYGGGPDPGRPPPRLGAQQAQRPVTLQRPVVEELGGRPFTQRLVEPALTLTTVRRFPRSTGVPLDIAVEAEVGIALEGAGLPQDGVEPERQQPLKLATGRMGIPVFQPMLETGPTIRAPEGEPEERLSEPSLPEDLNRSSGKKRPSISRENPGPRQRDSPKKLRRNSEEARGSRCVWAQWSAWSACSASCGLKRGTKARHRTIVRGSRKLCEDEEVVGRGYQDFQFCNNFPCSHEANRLFPHPDVFEESKEEKKPPRRVDKWARVRVRP